MKLIIFDGNSIINRAFYGIRPLINSKGKNTNSIYGFLNILLKSIEEEKPDYLCAAFDLRAPTFRKKIYNDYKAQRKGMPDELAEQLPVLKELLKSMNIKILECEGYEADDIIGTISKLCVNENISCVIVTGDKDDLQLVKENVVVKLTTTKQGKTVTESYSEKEVFNRYSVTPTELTDVKALMGDPSDNIPGVSGIGEKTALSLIAQYKNIEYIYQNIEKLDIKQALKDKLTADKDMAFLSKNLATICETVPIDSSINDCIFYDPFNNNFINFLKELEFTSVLTRLNLDSAPQNEELKTNSSEITAEQLKGKIKTSLYFLYESNSNTLAVNIDGDVFTFSGDLSPLFNIFSNEQIKKYTHDAKPFYSYLRSIGCELAGLAFDTAIAGYLLSPSDSSYNYLNISSLYTNMRTESIEGFCHLLPEITAKMITLLDEQQMNNLFYNIELPLIEVLSSMETVGIKVEKTKLNLFSLELDELISKLIKDIYNIADTEFNINSTKQLGDVLFNKLGLPIVKKTKTGFSTDVDVLNKLIDKHPIIDYILQYRQLTKLKSTYVDGLSKVIAEDGRIHSSFNQTVTTTGRISSTEPNLQNIPVRSEMGLKIRDLFISENDDYLLFDADYSQIELRVLADISNDQEMIQAFKGNADIHTKTASEIFDIPEYMVTPQMRTKAKAVNFGIVYGIGDYSLSQDIKVSRKKAREYIDSYLHHFSGVSEYMNNTIAKAREDGYVTTKLGRRRYIKELAMTNKNLVAFGERVALNAPIQGTAADIIKIAMVRVFNELKKNNLKAKLILQVHDELIVEAPKNEKEKVKEIMKSQMESVLELKVPLLVEVKEGKTWLEAK